MLTTVILTPGVGYPGSVLAGLTPFPVHRLHPVHRLENSWRLDSMRRRGASAAFARNPELQIGFGTLCELILGGLAWLLWSKAAVRHKSLYTQTPHQPLLAARCEKIMI